MTNTAKGTEEERLRDTEHLRNGVQADHHSPLRIGFH